MGNFADEADSGIGAGAGRPGAAKVPAKTPGDKRPRQGADPALFPFLEAEEGLAKKSASPWRGLSSYGSHAALAVCLFGFAWAASSYFSGGRSPIEFINSHLPGRAASLQEAAERAELMRNVQKMATDIHGLQTNVEALRAAQSQAAKGNSALEGIGARIDGARTEASTALAALSEKAGRTQRETETKLSEVIDRLGRLERELAAQAAAGDAKVITPPGAASAQKTPHISDASARPQLDAAEGQKKPRLITGWIVRDVYDGAALVEGRQGTIEVVPGDILPGAGRVKSIEKRGPGWIVITSEGVVDSIRNHF
jgi:hypothetical protein